MTDSAHTAPGTTLGQARRRALEITGLEMAALTLDAVAAHARTGWPECEAMPTDTLVRYLVAVRNAAGTATVTASWPDGNHLAQVPALPCPPGPEHVVDPEARRGPDPFDFDFEAAHRRRHLEVRDHWDDPDTEWALARLQEYLPLPDEALHAGADRRWTRSDARVADIRAAFARIEDLESELRETRELARELLAAGTANAEDLGYLQRHHPDLAHEQLPGWLTGETGAPETWQRPYADEEAAREAADPVEYDPDYGKDLDYEDEHEDEGKPDANEAAFDPDYPDEDDEYDEYDAGEY